jgi:hypothetical protein
MYLKKEIIISFFIITISASNLYMPMIWLYVFLQDFLIPFLCDPDLQCNACISGKLFKDSKVAYQVCKKLKRSKSSDGREKLTALYL